MEHAAATIDGRVCWSDSRRRFEGERVFVSHLACHLIIIIVGVVYPFMA